MKRKALGRSGTMVRVPALGCKCVAHNPTALSRWVQIGERFGENCEDVLSKSHLRVPKSWPLLVTVLISQKKYRKRQSHNLQEVVG